MYVILILTRVHSITLTLWVAPIQPTTKRDKMPIPRQSTPYKVSPKVTAIKSKVKPPPDVSQYSPQIQVTLYTYGKVILLIAAIVCIFRVKL